MQLLIMLGRSEQWFRADDTDFIQNPSDFAWVLTYDKNALTK